MPIKIIREDITKIKCDAIVNVANSTLLGGGGVDGAIHRAAGIGLLWECMKLKGCKTGQAKITGAYKLPCRYIIHTVGPKWKGGKNGEKELLESCYQCSLELAKQNHCESIAFPLISSGVYGYPKAQALQVAINIISSFLLENDMLVYIVVFDKIAYQIGEKLFSDIQTYIDDNYVDLYVDIDYARMCNSQCSQVLPSKKRSKKCRGGQKLYAPTSKPQQSSQMSSSMARQPIHHLEDSTTQLLGDLEDVTTQLFDNLEDAIKQIDESFSQMILRKIDENGMTDAQCYKKANIDRKLFSKIRNDVHYRPSKTTAIAFAIALELSLEETKDLLMKAGFALSHSNKFDIIIEYFISNKNYNIFEINEALFAFDQSLLGG